MDNFIGIMEKCGVIEIENEERSLIIVAQFLFAFYLIDDYMLNHFDNFLG